MTRYEYLKNRSVEEVAKGNIQNMFDTASYDYLLTSDGTEFIYTNSADVANEVWEQAYQHELEYLKSEVCQCCGEQLLSTGKCSYFNCESYLTKSTNEDGDSDGNEESTIADYWMDVDCTPFVGEVTEEYNRRIEEQKNKSDVAYRIYLGSNIKEPRVVCVQEFDIKDYDNAWMVSSEGKILQLFEFEYMAAFEEYGDGPEALVDSYLKEHMNEAVRQFNKCKHNLERNS